MTVHQRLRALRIARNLRRVITLFTVSVAILLLYRVQRVRSTDNVTCSPAPTQNISQVHDTQK